jgi:hypothetical protein
LDLLNDLNAQEIRAAVDATRRLGTAAPGQILSGAARMRNLPMAIEH